MAQPYPRWFSRALFVLIGLAVLIRLFYWHYTDRIWEDALITVLHSENAARGLGLTHLQPPGQPPLHGFTSPLSVLIPLLGDLVHVGWGLPFLKLVSAFAGGIAVWLGARIAQAIDLPPALALTAAAYLAFEHHQILWGMAGMETEVVTVAYLASVYVLLRGPGSPARSLAGVSTQWQKGLSLGFVMLARPDGAIWVAIAFAVELWRSRKSGSWRALVPVGGGLALLYAPWLIFTTIYYGSPVPNTIHAKSVGYAATWTQFHHSVGIEKLKWVLFRLFDTLGGLGPSYAGNGTGYMPVWDHHWIIASLMIVLCAGGFVLACRRRHTAALILYAFILSYTAYLMACAPIIYGWYTVPVAAAAAIGSFYGLWALAARFVARPARERVAGAVGLAYILVIVSILPLTFRSDKYVQKDIETGVRKQMGLYLGRVSLPTDTIASESLGYVGYYSRRVVYDYPGLCSRNVVQYLRDHPKGRNILAMMETLRPTYLVLRPRELFDAQGNERAPWINQEYDLVHVFQASPDARKNILFFNTNVDYRFYVYRLKGAPYNTAAQ